MKNRNFLMSDNTHKRLKLFAVEQGCTMDGAVKRLLDLKDSRPRPCKDHFEYTMKVVEIGNTEGPEAAQRFMRENPYVEG